MEIKNPDNFNRTTPAKEPEAEKRVAEPVVTNVKRKKKNEAKKIFGLFLPEDMGAVRESILLDFFVPLVKDTVAGIVSMILYDGDSRRISGRSWGRSSSREPRNYNKISDTRRDERRDYTRPNPIGGYDFDDISFTTRGDAELVLDSLEEMIQKYGWARVADFYDLVGVTGSYTDNKYGWMDIRSARITRVRDGYIIQLPRVSAIE